MFINVRIKENKRNVGINVHRIESYRETENDTVRLTMVDDSVIHIEGSEYELENKILRAVNLHDLVLLSGGEEQTYVSLKHISTVETYLSDGEEKSKVTLGDGRVFYHDGPAYDIIINDMEP